jgi:hypothetical protein
MRFRTRTRTRIRIQIQIVPLALGLAAPVALAAALAAQTPEPAASPLVTPAAPAAPAATATATTATAPAHPTPRATVPASRTPARRATPTASQAAAARELFKSLKLQESMDGTAAAMVDSEIAHNPPLAPYRDVMLSWLRKYMTWDAMLPELTQLYSETYTEGEMKALAMFYASPVGQKSLAKTSELLTRTAAIGAKISQPHSAELNAQLSARRDELKAQAAARTPGAVSSPPPAAAVPAGTPAPPAARPTAAAAPVPSPQGR